MLSVTTAPAAQQLTTPLLRARRFEEGQQRRQLLQRQRVHEDAHHNTAKLDAVPSDCMEQRDEENLALAKSWMPKLPCDRDGSAR
jgi:hypothetical protein